MTKICTCGHKESLHAEYHIEENQKITLWCVECLCDNFDDCTKPNFCSCLNKETKRLLEESVDKL